MLIIKVQRALDCFRAPTCWWGCFLSACLPLLLLKVLSPWIDLPLTCRSDAASPARALSIRSVDRNAVVHMLAAAYTCCQAGTAHTLSPAVIVWRVFELTRHLVCYNNVGHTKACAQLDTCILRLSLIWTGVERIPASIITELTRIYCKRHLCPNWAPRMSCLAFSLSEVEWADHKKNETKSRL